MARKGERIVTNTELESRMRSTKKRLDAVNGFLVSISGNVKTNFMIQAGHDDFAGAGTAKSFPFAFKTGTVPLVILSSTEATAVVVMNGAATAAGFTGYGRLISDGSAVGCEADWIAIGERG